MGVPKERDAAVSQLSRNCLAQSNTVNKYIHIHSGVYTYICARAHTHKRRRLTTSTLPPGPSAIDIEVEPSTLGTDDAMSETVSYAA